MGMPNESHVRMRSSLPGMSSLPGISAYERDEQNPLKEEKEAYSRSSMIAASKYTNGGDALQERTTSTLKMKNSTIESHL